MWSLKEVEWYAVPLVGEALSTLTETNLVGFFTQSEVGSWRLLSYFDCCRQPMWIIGLYFWSWSTYFNCLCSLNDLYCHQNSVHSGLPRTQVSNDKGARVGGGLNKKPLTTNECPKTLKIKKPT